MVAKVWCDLSVVISWIDVWVSRLERKVTQCRVLITTKSAAEEYNRPMLEVLHCPHICVSEFVRPKYAHSLDGMGSAVRELRKCTTTPKSRETLMEAIVLSRVNRCTSILEILMCFTATQ
jgi:hypothetical protein